MIAQIVRRAHIVRIAMTADEVDMLFNAVRRNCGGRKVDRLKAESFFNEFVAKVDGRCDYCGLYGAHCTCVWADDPDDPDTGHEPEACGEANPLEGVLP